MNFVKDFQVFIKLIVQFALDRKSAYLTMICTMSYDFMSSTTTDFLEV